MTEKDALAAPRRVAQRDVSDIAREWDRLAGERHRQVEQGLDLSFSRVVAPTALALLGECPVDVALDVGAGTGHFSRMLIRRARQVVAIEPSAVSLDLARTLCADEAGIRFVHGTLEQACTRGQVPLADAALAIMVLSSVPDLDGFAHALAGRLRPGAPFIATLPHPVFWSHYWGYADEPWFQYSEEQFVEATFRIAQAQTGCRATHVHRPLNRYVNGLHAAGFRLERIEEPMPPEDVARAYPEPWRVPRFLALRWVRA